MNTILTNTLKPARVTKKSGNFLDQVLYNNSYANLQDIVKETDLIDQCATARRLPLETLRTGPSTLILKKIIFVKHQMNNNRYRETTSTSRNELDISQELNIIICQFMQAFIGTVASFSNQRNWKRISANQWINSSIKNAVAKNVPKISKKKGIEIFQHQKKNKELL